MSRFLARNFRYSGSFNGTDNYVSIGRLGSFGSTLGSGYSISCWLKSKSKVAGTIFGTRVSATNNYFLFKTNTQSGSNSAEFIQFQFTDPGNKTTNGYARCRGLNNGDWHHIVATLLPSSNTITIYLDGVAQTVSYTTQSTPDTFANFANPVFIGALNNNGTVAAPYYTGLLDDLAIWSGIISADEATELYHNGSVTNKIPYAYIKLDEGTGSVVSDSVNSANIGSWNGTLGSQWSQDIRSSARLTATRTSVGQRINLNPRSTARTHLNSLYLPGSSGNLATTPSSDALNISGDIDVVLRIMPESWTPSANSVIISKYDPSTNQRGYQFSLLSTGALRFTLSESGTSAIDATSSVIVTPPSTKVPMWVRATWRQADGRVQFFTMSDRQKLEDQWTQLGSNQTISINDIHPSNQVLRFGANTVASGFFAGRIYRTIIRNGIGGTPALDVDFTKYEPDSTAFSEDSVNRAVVSISKTGSPIARIDGGYTCIEVLPAATVTVGTPPSITKTATPFDGIKSATSIGLFTPIWSDSNYVYLTEATDDNKTRAAKLNKSLASQENVQTYSATVNSDAGHRGASIATSASGTVITYPEGHDTAWIGKHSTQPQDLSTLTNTDSPVGSVQKNAYKRYFRNPNNGDIWMTQRGDGWYAYVRKWDDVNKRFNTVGGGAIAGWGGNQTNAVYGIELAFSADTVYLLLEWSDAGTGYPRRDASVAKSTDGGDTWTTMMGTTLTLPIVPGDTSVALPSPNRLKNLVEARIAVDGSGNPMVISPYTTTSGVERSLYFSKWDPDENRWKYKKLASALNSTSIGNISAHYYNSHIYVLFSQYDEHDDVNWTTSNPAVPWARTGALYLYDTSDGGETWTSYTLDDGLGVDVFYGGYFDPEALRIDGKFRILPVCGSDFAVSEIWEFTL